MKRITALLLVQFFLITNSCVAVRIHWCGGTIASIDCFANELHSCKCGKKAMKPGCCKDDTVQLKANTEFAKTPGCKVRNNIILKLHCIRTQKHEIVPIMQFRPDWSFYYLQPPYKLKAPIFLFERVLLI